MNAKKTANPFLQYQQALTAEQASELSALFQDIDRRVALPNLEKAKIRQDFERALLYYGRAGVPFEEARQRIDPEHLGGFYARPPINWYPLDNAAKVYPLSMKHGQMAVFRMSAYMKQKVVPEILQMALTFTIKRFPGFATTVKKGFFWHYLDTSKRRYNVEEESFVPCLPLKISVSGSQSFRVVYWNNRISCEYFHLLTDGTGGMEFLKVLVGEYLRLMGVTAQDRAGMLNIDDAPDAGEMGNEFTRADKHLKPSGFIDKPATQLSGKLSHIKPCCVVQFDMPAHELAAAAHARGVTVTALVLAMMFLACKSATDELNGEFNIQVPVNMRKYYPSATLRNFTMYCGIRLPISSVTTVDGILPEITRQLTQKASRESMSEMMKSTGRMVSAVRYVPLFIKAPLASVAYGFLGDKIFTNTLSNMGVIHLPEEFAREIESMDFILGTALTNRASCAMGTFGDVATLSVSKNTKDPSFEEALNRQILALGITPRVKGSELYES